MENYIYKTKLEALQELFSIENIEAQWTSKKLSYAKFLDIISKDSYNLKEDTGLAAQTIFELNKKLFPDKIGNLKPCTYLLNKYGLKYCLKCKHVYDVESFHNNARKSTGKQHYCKTCFNDSVRVMRKEYVAHRKAEKLNATPNWANLDEIKKIYDKCPDGYHVDHEVPLKGDFVCGLHVEHNLKYLTAKDNITKSNAFNIDTYNHSIEYTKPYSVG